MLNAVKKFVENDGNGTVVFQLLLVITTIASNNNYC